MTSNKKFLISNEFKNYKVDAPLVDQIVGSTRRAAGGGRLDSIIYGIIIYCRGHTSEAKSRADEHANNDGIKVAFKVVENETDN